MSLRSDFNTYCDNQTGWAETTEETYRLTFSYLASWLDQNNLTLANATIRTMKDFIQYRHWGNAQSRLLNAVVTPFVRARYGPDHPLAKWRIKHEKHKPQRTLTQNDLERLLSSFQPGISADNLPINRRFWTCDTNHPMGIRNLAIVWMLIDTGYRSRELCRMSLNTMDLSNRSVVVKIKGADYGKRYYSEQAEAPLHAWLAVRQKFITKDSGDALFIGLHNSSRGKRITHNGLRVMLRKLGNLTGVYSLSPHVFRRTIATTMQTQAKAPSRIVQKYMDWKSIERAELYSLNMEKEYARDYLPGTFLFAGK